MRKIKKKMLILLGFCVAVGIMMMVWFGFSMLQITVINPTSTAVTKTHRIADGKIIKVDDSQYSYNYTIKITKGADKGSIYHTKYNVPLKTADKLNGYMLNPQFDPTASTIMSKNQPIRVQETEIKATPNLLDSIIIAGSNLFGTTTYNSSVSNQHNRIINISNEKTKGSPLNETVKEIIPINE